MSTSTIVVTTSLLRYINVINGNDNAFFFTGALEGVEMCHTSVVTRT